MAKWRGGLWGGLLGGLFLLEFLGDVVAQTTDPVELQVLHETMRSMNFEYDWESIFPDPCSSGPQGILCAPDAATGLLVVTEIQFGYISPIANLIPCSANATIPASLARLTHLESLAFHSCFSGSSSTAIPSPLPASLRLLSFTNNPSLRGQIPGSLTNLQRLSRLVLSQNDLSGEIPASLANLTALTQLDLSHNRLAGGIPELPGALVNLDVRYNNLSGMLPPLSASLQRLALSYNRFTGPVALADLGSLTFLDLSHNRFNGELALESMSSLEDLFLSANPELHGAIPASLASFRNLVRVDLSGCALSGPIPELHLKELRFFAVSGNRLSGPIPSSFATLPRIFTLNLDANQLSGPVPFPVAFVKRMGRNLRLGDNPGLCYTPQMVFIKVPLGLNTMCAAPLAAPNYPPPLLPIVTPDAAGSTRCSSFSLAVALAITLVLL